MAQAKTKVHVMTVNSWGGLADEAFNIISHMRRLQAKGHYFICIGEKVVSAAFSIFMACDKRLGRHGSLYMQHMVRKCNMFYCMRDWHTRELDKIQYDLAMQHVKLPGMIWVNNYIEKERFFTNKEAHDIGVIDGYESN